MITKGYIEEIINGHQVKVRCPTLDAVKGSNRYIENLSTCVICTLPSTYMNVNIGDVVFVGFEDNSRYKPIVLGYLYKSNFDPSYSSMALGSIVVHNRSNFSKDTSIGDIASSCIANVSGTTGNIQSQLNSVNKDISDVGNSVSEVNHELQSIEKTIELVDTNIDKNYQTILSIKSDIGNEDDKKSSTIYGALNVHETDLNNINNYIGVVSNDTSIFDMLLKLQQDCDSVFSILGNSQFSNNSISTESSSMLGRAEKMVNVAWTPNNSFKCWNSDTEYKKGVTYIGMPYTQSSSGYSYDSWLKNSENNSTITMTSSYGTRSGPKYGSCCADFVSEVIGLPTILRTVSGLLSETKYLTQLSGNLAKVSNIKVGDVLINSSKGHAIWVGDISDGNITIYEQTPSIHDGVPKGARKTTYKLSDKTDSNGYFFVYSNSSYIYACRPTEELLALPSNKTHGSSATVKGSDYTWHYDFINKLPHRLTSEQMEANAMCIAKEMQKKGWAFNPICALLGNIEVECVMNPDQGADSGVFGLIQWTPSTWYHTTFDGGPPLCEKYAGTTNWKSNGPAQCEVIDQMYRKGQGFWGAWSGKSVYGMSEDLSMTFEEFVVSNEDIDTLTSVFCACAERPSGNGDYPRRRECAHKWKEFLLKKFGKISD